MKRHDDADAVGVAVMERLSVAVAVCVAVGDGDAVIVVLAVQVGDGVAVFVADTLGTGHCSTYVFVAEHVASFSQWAVSLERMDSIPQFSSTFVPR